MLSKVKVSTGSDIGVAVELEGVFVRIDDISDEGTCEYVYMSQADYEEFARRHIEVFGLTEFGAFTYNYNFGTVIPKLEGHMNDAAVFNQEYVAVIKGNVYVAVPADWNVVDCVEERLTGPDYTIVGDNIKVNTDIDDRGGYSAVYIEGYGEAIVSWTAAEVMEEEHIFARIAQLIALGYEAGCEALAAEIGLKWSLEKGAWVVGHTHN